LRAAILGITPSIIVVQNSTNIYIASRYWCVLDRKQMKMYTYKKTKFRDLVRLYKLLFLLHLFVSMGAIKQSRATAENNAKNTTKIFRDKYGAPTCLLNKNDRFLHFLWSKDPFERTVYAKHYTSRYRLETRTQPRRRITRIDLVKTLCLQKSRQYLSNENSATAAKLIKILEQLNLSDQVEGFEISNELKKDFLNIERAGNFGGIPTVAMTAKEYLERYPIQNYTVELNRQLSKKYGPGFSAEIYEEWESQKPQNIRFLNRLLINADLLAKNPMHNIRSSFQQRKLLLVKGLGHELKSAARFEPLTDELTSLGVNYSIVSTQSFDSIAKNGALVMKEIEATLNQGTNVILMSLSKGSTEVLWALKSLYEKWHTHGKPAHYGKIETSLSMSGVAAGSFLIDWITDDLRFLFAKPQLLKELKKEGLMTSDLIGLKNLAHKFMDKLVDEINQQVTDKIFDTTMPFINVVGILDGNGLSTDSYVRDLQEAVVRKNLSNFGANDGYIEYPGTTTQDNWSQSKYVLPMKASHAIIDGHLQGMSLSDDQSRRLILGSLLITTIEAIENKLEL